MSYLIEVVRDCTGGEFNQDWHSRSGELKSANFVNSAELYTFSENIRDADYTHISLLEFRSDVLRDQYLSQSTDFSRAETIIDQVKCDLDVAIGGFGSVPSGHVFLINPFEIAQEDISDVLDMWHKAKGHMIGYDGFVNARLFRSHDPSAKYGLVNVAQWASPEAFKAALSDRAYDKHRDRSLKYKLHPSLCINETREDRI